MSADATAFIALSFVAVMAGTLVWDLFCGPETQFDRHCADALRVANS
jgi:hypothetical protein